MKIDAYLSFEIITRIKLGFESHYIEVNEFFGDNSVLADINKTKSLLYFDPGLYKKTPPDGKIICKFSYINRRRKLSALQFTIVADSFNCGQVLSSIENNDCLLCRQYSPCSFDIIAFNDMSSDEARLFRMFDSGDLEPHLRQFIRQERSK